jgi:hypothetical protein
LVPQSLTLPRDTVIPFDTQPRPIEVPRASVAAAYSPAKRLLR